MMLWFLAVALQSTQADDQLVVVGQNVQNFFYSLDRNRTKNNGVAKSNYTTVDGRTAKLNAIVNALETFKADIYAFNEIEVKVAGSADDEDALKLLAQAMSEKTGNTYAAVSDEQTYTLDAEPDGVIRSGFIYNTETVETVGANVSTAIGYKNVYPAMLRMQTFKSKASGESFTLSMNHFKASTSTDITADIEKRESNSISLLKGLNQATDPDILVLGDLNSETGELCLNNLENVGFEEQILKYHPDDYSHWYGSKGNLIDHVFANSTMAKQITDAGIRYIANPHSVGSSNAYSDHDPYVVTLNLKAQPAPTYSYTKATAVVAGKSYLIVANQSKAANAVDINKSYEYQTATDVTPDDDVITMQTNKNGFRFEDDGSGNYLIKDYYGRYFYLYYNETYSKYNNTTNAGNKKDAHPHSVTFQSDGTFKIYNNTGGYNMLFQTSYNNFSWRNWTSLQSGQYWPQLYEYDPTITPTAIETVSSHDRQTVTTRKVLLNGRLIIMVDGRQYNMQGMEINH